MNAEDSLKLARRFIGLPLEKRQMFLAALHKEGVDFARFPIPQGVEADDRQALSYAQQRMWFLWQLDPHSGAYNLPGAVRLTGRLSLTALEAAFASLMARHETLRTVFQRQADDSLLQVPAEAPLVIEHVDFSGLAAPEREVAVADAAQQQSLQPFDLAVGPLLRVKLLKLDEQEHVLLLTLHHIVSDGWSMNVLIDEFIRCYDAHEAGQSPQLVPLPIQYSDYALWQRRWLEAGEQARQLEYWQAQLGNEHPVLELPTDHPRPAMPSYRGTRYEFAIDGALAEQLRSSAQQHNITLFMLLLGAFNVLLHRYTGQSDIRVGVPIANRNRGEIEGLIGFFVNTQVLRTELDGQTRVGDLLRVVKETALGAQAHQDLPFERLVEALKLERSLSHTPLFQVMYNHQPQVADISTVSTASGLELGVIEWQGRTTQFDLTLDTYEKGGRLHAALTYANDLFDPQTITRMAQHWLNLLRGMVQNSNQRISDLPLLEAAEYQRMVFDWNSAQASTAEASSIHRLIEQQVTAQPDALAVTFGEQTFTYVEVDARANALAHKLIECGVGPEVRVGVAMQRSDSLLVALLAVLKAGGAYVPLDPDYPADRVAYMLEDSRALVLLTEQAVAETLSVSAETQVLLLDRIAAELAAYPSSAPVTAVTPDNLAYVIYTSGSTGKPKGVAIAHRNVQALIDWSRTVYSRDDIQGVLASTSVCFDLSVWELFVTLANGGSVIIARNALELPQLPARDQVRLINTVPSAINALQRDGAIPSSVRIINLAGEPLKQSLVEALYQQASVEHVYDLYGPSEDTTYSTWTRRSAGGTPSIGRPLTGTASYLLDADLQPVPQGAAAELYLAGAGITRGYLGRAAMTAEKYVPNPFANNGERLYRTGDLTRYQADGALQYVGRIDHQVKVRGFRIELGEIEARLLQQDAVRELAVLAQEGASGQQLVAYIVPTDAAVLAADADAQASLRETLKAALRQHLPDYMVPAYLLFLEQLPLTPNGKLDRKALPAVDGSQQQREHVAPRSALEKALAAIWQDVLSIENVGLEDNFFELGGDSIVSMQVVSRARQAGIVLSPKELFQHQTIRSLAQVARQGQQTLIDQGPAVGAVALAPVQQWFFEQDIPQRQHWNQSLLLTAQQPVDAGALDRALSQLLNHHDALRLRYESSAEGWQQAYAAPTGESVLWQRNAQSLEDLKALCDEAQRSLDLSNGPLLRAMLVNLADGSQRLLLVAHHLVIDGVSWRVLLEDLQAAYTHALRGAVGALPGKTSSYQQWVARLQGHLPTFAESLDYWQAQLRDAPHAELPCERPDGALENRFEDKVELKLSAEQTRKLLQQAPAAYRTQVNDLLLTALARVVCRWSGQASTLIQLEGHGREDLFDDVDLTRTLGWFTSLFPVNLRPADNLGASIKAIKEQLRAVPDKGLSYGALRYLADAQTAASLNSDVKPRITFNYLGQFDRQFDEAALFVPSGEGGGAAQDPSAPLANWLTVEGQVYGGELALNWGFSREMFDAATVQQLADQYALELNALIDHCCALEAPQATPSDFPLARVTQAQLDALPVPAGELDDLYPLSPMQQGLLFHTLYEQAAGEYINQMRVDVQGIDPQRFRDAWQATVDAQDILRSGFVWQGELAEPVQIVHKQVQLPFTALDWRSRDDQPQALAALADAERQQGFDLTCAPLLRLVLVQTDAEQWHLIYTHHHILMDGWSNSQLLGEVLQRYSGQIPANAGGRYRDYIAWLQRQDARLSENFWGEQLAALQEPTRLARVASTSDSQSGHGDHFQTLDVAQTRVLETFARQQKVTVNTLIQAAWLLLLQRYTGHEAVAFGATVAGRPADLPGIEQQVGLFINTLPVIGAPRPDQRVGHWLQAVQGQNLGLRDFEHTPLADIQRWAGQGGEVLFDNILVFENYPIAQALKQGADQGVVFGEVANLEQTHYALSVAVTLGEQLALHYSFDRGHFAHAAIEGISAHLLQLLEQFAVSAERSLGEIALADAGEHARQQADNHPQPYPVDVAVHQRISALAAERPQRTAVIFNGQHFSYGEIDQRANQLAHALMARGVGAETRVGVALPRSESVIVALLAVLKAGGAYVPLDTSYPRERLAYLIEDSGLALLISDSSVSAQLPVAESVPVLELDRLDLREWPIKAPQVQLDPDNLAYVIYTSGSTGNPKGVSVAHGPLAMHCQAIGQRYEMRDSDCEFHFMSFAFDGAHERWLTSLTHGASLLIRDDTLWTPEQTYNAMREHGVTVVAFPPVYLQQLAEHAEREGNPPKVRIYCFGGDAVPSASFERVKRALDPDYIINGYGPTETVVTPLIWKAGREVPCGAAYAPIGSRIGDRSAYVLDADLNLLPQGMAGELYLGGTGLARGYLNRPGLTAERFVADPFSHTGGLLYRTGDLVRQRADGTFDYLDRIDNQVKIRGFRIELGEIEACLQALDGVREAVVVAQEGSAGSGKRLVAYVVGDSAREDFAEDLREQLKATLPAHMVPAYVLRLERMPLTPNGKLDRKNLPKPDVSQLQQAYVAPQTVLEQQLATIWQDVLKLQQVGVSDNFFELGGDSIISIQVVSRARQAGIRFTPKDLFQHQTIAALAAVAKVGEQAQAIDQGPVTGALPLLAVQQAFFEQDIPERQHWNQAVMLKPTQPLQAAALEQALGALVAHHDGLRLSFVEQADGWHAEYRSLDSRNDALLWSVDVADAAALEAVANEAQRSLDLQAGPLLRAVLANLDDGSQRLLLAIHHLVVDGVSWRILFDDLQSAYRQIAAGEPLQLPAKTSAAKAWAEHLQTYARSSELRSELAYWQEQLQGVDVALPLDNADGGLQNRHALTVRTRLDKALTRQLLQDAPAAYRTQVNDLLLTALARVMVRWTGADSALIQLEGHGREELFDSIDLTRTVGWFTTVYPAKLTPVAELGASLKQIKEQLRAIPNKGIGFGALAYLGEQADRASLAQLPVPRLTFNYLGQFDGSFDAADGALFVPSSEAAGDELNANAPLANQLALNGQVYGGELNLGWTFSHEMFDEATIQRLADDYAQELQALIAHCCQADHHGVTPSDFPLARLSQAQLDGLPLVPQLIEDVYPLSPMQQGMLFHAVYEESTGNYINQMRLDVEGLDPERFHQAWQAAVDAHDILRTRFVWQGELDAPVQVVSKHAQMPYSLHDWRAQPHREDALQTLADAERQSLDLNASTLLRLVIVRIDDQRHHLIYTNHHILMDGWSNSQLLGEVLQRYSGKFSAAHAGRYGDYIGWLQRQDAAASEAFWLPALRTLDEPTRLAHAIARPKDAPAVQGYGDHYRVLDSEQTARLGEFARASKVTVNTFVQAAWLLVLQRYTGKASIAFGATVAGRPADLPGIEQQIGLFINTLPVIASPRPEQSLGSWLQAVQAQNLALREFEHTALFDIQRWAGQGGEALFDNILVFENYPIAQALEQGAPQGLRFGPVANHEQTNYPLTLGVSLEGTLEVHYSFDREHFADATVEQLGAQLNHVLMQMAGGSDQRCLGDLQLLDAASRELALNDWGYCAGHYPTALHVHQLFEQQVQRAPDQVALYFADQRLTYAELNQQANRLAHTLRQRGVGPDVLVGIAVERSLEMIISLLAVLKAGGAYVPLDPQYPSDRLTCMIEDSGLLLLLSQSHLLERLPQVAGVEVLCVDRQPEQLESADLPNLTLADNLAYVMFTSGSTGRPKGVGINQASLTKHAYVTVDLMALTAQDCVLQFSTFNFDGFVEQLYPALITGASVVLRGTEIWDSETLYTEMLDKRISVIDLTTAYWGMLAKDFAEVGPRDYGVLRQVHAGGEAMPPEGMAAWNKAGLAHVRLLNTYGPTEATVTATSLDCGDYVTGAEPTPSTLPIGSALPGRSIYLLDIAGQPVPVGAVGELMIGGELLARGYFNRPDLSAERFMPDPFSVQPGARLYRTGDLARFRADGVIEYIGRVDHQVKIRGFRIELGEIEARLLDAQTVRETLVMAVAGPSGQQLVAYVVPTDAEPVMADNDLQSELRRALREQLQQTLPDYMVPTHLLFLAKMPLSPNGKLDRHALPKPDAAQAQQDYLAATNTAEQTLVDIWQAVLGLAQIGVTDNFFELGGDSIVSIQVVSRARQAGIHFSPKDLFQHQTIQGLASVARVGEGGFVIDQSPVTGASLLLPAQLQFFEEGVAEPHHWNQSVLLNTSQTLDAGHLKAALDALIEHHDALRLSFASVDGQWTAQHRAVGEQPEDLLWQTQVADAAELEALGLEAQRSLALGGPLLRAVLATLADGTQRLLLVIHHLVVDGVSWRVLLEDLQGLYQQISSAQPVKLPARTSAFKTWAERLHAYASSETLLAEQPYWLEQLQNVSSQLPVDHADGSLQSRHEHTVQTRLGADLTRKLLQDAPAAYRTQVNDLLLTALARVISRWTGEDSTLIQLEGHGREDLFADIDLSRSVGWFTSLFPVKLTASAELGASLKAVKEQLRAIPNKGIGFGVLRYLGSDAVRETLRALPQPAITFNYLGQFDSSFDAGQAALFTPSSEARGAEQSLDALLSSPLTLNGGIYGGEFSLGWTFSERMFERGTVQALADDYAQELAALIEHCCRDGVHGVTPSDFPLAPLSQTQLDGLPLPASLIEDIYPLSPMQQGMLFHTLYEEEAGDYINQTRADVQGLDVERFRAAWQAALQAHDVLRSGFLWQGERPVQVVHKQVELPFSVQDWRGRRDYQADLDALAAQERKQGFELTAAPLLRLCLVRIDDDTYHLIYTNHHILMDGWGNSQLMGEVLHRYSGQPLAQSVGRYRDYIAWLQRQDGGVSESFWKTQLADLQEPTRLTQAIARRDDLMAVVGYADHQRVMNAAATRQLAEFAREQKVTLNTLVQAAWLLLLQRYSGQDTVAFGATVAGRPADLKGIEQQIGLFINTLPVIGTPRAEQSVGQWLHTVQTQNLSLREHEHTPLFEIQRWAGKGGDALFDSILVFENYPVSEAMQQGAPAGLRFTDVTNHEQTNYPLTLAVSMGDTLSLHFSYGRAHFAEVDIARLGEHLHNLLTQMMQGGALALGQLELLSSEEQQQQVEQWNATATEYPLSRSVHSLIEEQVRATPDALALVFGEQRLTYAQLNARANQLAAVLIEHGVGPEVLVGISVERSLEMVVGLLAILKAGGAYLPLDPEYPQDRLAYMFEDSGIALLLTQSHLLAQLPVPAGLRSLVLDQEGDWLEGRSEANPELNIDPENLAYVIYTSGSTGKPKGAGNRHSALVNRLCWMQQAYQLTAEDSVLQKTPFSFDVSVWEFFWPLMTGSSLVVAAPGVHRDPAQLIQVITEQRITTLHFVPSMLQAFLQDPAVAECTSLTRIVCSGEALQVDAQQQVFAKLPNAGLFNLYGPTEAAIDVTHWTCRDEGRDSVPIGQPIANLSTYILDNSLAPLPVGVIGELYLGGEGLARGYHRRPALTAERFVTSPFGDGQRLYRTGDLARYRADGVIEYAGRMDHQVKIRGLRIELGEIEARLAEHDDVRETVVIAQDGSLLVGYVVPNDARLVEADEASRSELFQRLKEHLARNVPDYMVPLRWVLLAKMPVSPNGKLERKALPKFDASQAQQAFVAPSTELQQQVAAIWQDVLQLERIGLNDNFFELGGHSLLAVTVVSRLQLELGLKLTPQLIFQHPALGDFVSQLDAADEQVDMLKLSKLESLLDEMEEA
ncbi:non-ribosomal peptide synthase/polyketide synthase [Pseudomonas allokribbensis]|uniref:non-ribosomal peptide synthase/polyketide synthase n=1 Tax=Pseudomonas allokribbensis TaxID=2774460 RepID=UPI0017882D9D|nr:non-ribosomal peptide synthase/polyketide synthase [Pseudomonas allokribbensis]